MNKKVAVFILALLMCIAIWSAASQELEGKEETLLIAWQKMEAKDTTFNLNAYGTLSHGIKEQEQLEDILQYACQYLGGVNIKTQYRSHPGYQEARAAYLVESDVYVELMLQTMLEGKETEKPIHTAIVVNITGVNLDFFLTYKVLLEQVLLHLGCTAPVNFSLMGIVDNLSAKEVSGLVYELWSELQATTVDFYVDKQAMSLSAYSPLLPNNPYGWSFNVQLALRHGPDGQDYTVWLGWPAIGHSY